jgi:hypothetical protein
LDFEGAVRRIVDEQVTKVINATENISRLLLDTVDSKADIVLNIVKDQSSDLLGRIDSSARSVASVVGNTSAGLILAGRGATKMIESSAGGFLGEFQTFNSNFKSELHTFNRAIIFVALFVGSYYCLLVIEKVIFSFLILSTRHHHHTVPFQMIGGIRMFLAASMAEKGLILVVVTVVIAVVSFRPMSSKDLIALVVAAPDLLWTFVC